MIEIEVKIKIYNIKDITEKISSRGTKLEKERYFEENTLYDFSSQNLYQCCQALRLRKINKKNYLTFKGSPLKSRKFKVREEYETEVKNEKQIKNILKSLGLIPMFKYDKYRTVYRKRDLKICIDETSIGNFLELEGDQNKISKFAKSLGFSKDKYIKQDYVQLIKNEKLKGKSKIRKT